MSKKERLVASLDRITDLCFTISELGIGEGSDEEDARPPSSSLSAGAPGFTPARKGLPSTSGIQGSLSSLTISDDWQSVPEFPSVSEDTPPSFCQVVGGSQSVYVTPVRRTRAQSVDSVSSVMAAPQQPNWATCNAQQFNTYYDNLAGDPQRVIAETAAFQHGVDSVKIAAMLKRDQRRQNELNAAQQAAQQAQAAAQQAQQALAAAQAAQQAAQVAVAAPRLSPPPKFENKEKDLKIQQWLPMLDTYMAGTPANQYFRMASSYLGGKPRSYWISQYEAWRAAHPGQEPPNPPQFFRDTLLRGYGLVDPVQSYWDTWNKLSQGSSDIHEYNTAFQLALADLNREITDEQDQDRALSVLGCSWI